MGNSSMSSSSIRNSFTEMFEAKTIQSFPILFRCQIFPNDQIKGIALYGDKYENNHGRGHSICLVPKDRAMFFDIDGDINTSFAVRVHDDTDLSLEISYRKFENGTAINLWSCKPREWALKFCVNPDMTISPLNSGKPTNLVLGAKEEGGRLVITLVYQDNAACKLVLESPEQVIRRHIEAIQSARDLEEANRRLAIKGAKNVINNRDTLFSLKQDGFIHLPAVIDISTIKKALQEVNRMLGASMFAKGTAYSTSSPVTELVEKSSLTYILQDLLESRDPIRVHGGQIALRFPGDMCIAGTCESTSEHFNCHRRSWHIDGLPTNFTPGVTDHFGEIKNFDALVGVILTDLDEPFCGELCVYPSSHFVLSEYFNNQGLYEVSQRGPEAMPPSSSTDSIFLRPPVHCIGKAGDVFILNYLTAHFVAPNTSSNIRYAVYFRVKGPSFEGSDSIKAPVHCPDSMLSPWLHWPIIDSLPL